MKGLSLINFFEFETIAHQCLPQPCFHFHVLLLILKVRGLQVYLSSARKLLVRNKIGCLCIVLKRWSVNYDLI